MDEKKRGDSDEEPLSEPLEERGFREIVEIADLPEKETTGSYTFRREHLIELVRHLRSEGDQDV